MGSEPLELTGGEANLGGAGLARGARPRWELATVVTYNSATHTAAVRTREGRPLKDVPQLRSGPNDFEHLPQGTGVVVSWDLGFPAIIGCINFVSERQAALQPTNITGVDGVGDDNPLQPTQGSQSFKPPLAPTDLTEGDWARTGTHGNHVAVLEGGLSSLGSPSALFRSIGLSGVLQLIGRALQTFTDFGEWKTVNDQGRTSFILRAGASQSTQSGMDEQHWTIRLDVGDSGDLFDLRITDPIGKNLFRFHVGADGQVQLYGEGGVDISSGPTKDASTRHDIAGSRTTTIGGSESVTTKGDHGHVVSGNMTETVGGDKSIAIEGSSGRLVQNDETIATGGKRTDVVTGGDPLSARPGNLAIETRLVNGGWLVDIGNPSQGANITAQAGFQLRTSLGNIAFEAGGNLDLHAQGITDVDGQLVNLGGTKHPLPLWDTYLKAHADFVDAVIFVLQGGTTTGPMVNLPGKLAQLILFKQRMQSVLPFASNKVRNG